MFIYEFWLEIICPKKTDYFEIIILPASYYLPLNRKRNAVHKDYYHLTNERSPVEDGEE